MQWSQRKTIIHYRDHWPPHFWTQHFLPLLQKGLTCLDHQPSSIIRKRTIFTYACIYNCDTLSHNCLYIKIFTTTEHCSFNPGKMGNTFIIKSYMCKRSVNDISVWENRILRGCENIQNFSSGGKYLAQQASEIFSNSGRDILHHEEAIYVAYFNYINTNEISNHFTDLLCNHSNSDLYTFHLHLWRDYVFKWKLI